jgi:hypothetical protein
VSGSRDLRARAPFLLKLPSGLLTISLSYSVFIAGMLSVTNRIGGLITRFGSEPFSGWCYRCRYLLGLAVNRFGRRVVVASLPILQIALQYVLVHRALDGRLPIGVGLHAVNAALMLLVAIALTLG